MIIRLSCVCVISLRNRTNQQTNKKIDGNFSVVFLKDSKKEEEYKSVSFLFFCLNVLAAELTC
jgi:hypothetical protein